MPISLIKTSRKAIDTLPREKTLVLFPVGGIEDHGPHLPLGLDLFQARKLSEILATKIEKLDGWRVLIAPEAPMSVQTVTTDFALNSRPYILRDWLVDSARALNRQGFRHFACVSGTMSPQQLTAIEEAGKIYRRFTFLGATRGYFHSASSAIPDAKEVWRSPFYPNPKEHGGKGDTSEALWICAGDVDPTYKQLPARTHRESGLGYALSRMKRSVKGYWGSPNEASVEIGEKSIESTAERMFEKLQLVLAGARPGDHFRTWYSVVPSNRSFFKGWLLMVALLVLLLIWVYFVLNFFGL